MRICLPTCHLESNDLKVQRAKYTYEFAKTISIVLHLSSNQSENFLPQIEKMGLLGFL